jgi:hypothetical protein
MEEIRVKPTTKTDWGRFLPADKEDRYRVLWASQGVGGSGKSHFALTAPDPIAYMLFDPKGLEGLVRQEQFRDKDIRVIEYKFNPGKVKEDDRGKVALDSLHQFVEDFSIALKVARTIVWDKEDAIWEMLRYARLDAVSGRPANYYELNLEYRAWFQDAADAGVNLGVIRGMKEVWGTRINKKTGAEQPYSTGEYEPRGMKEVPELVQVTLEHRWEDGFKIRIGNKCRLNGELIGEEFEALTFNELAMTLYPESSDEDWR